MYTIATDRIHCSRDSGAMKRGWTKAEEMTMVEPLLISRSIWEKVASLVWRLNVIKPSNVSDNHCIANLIGDKNLLTQIHSETTIQPEKTVIPEKYLTKPQWTVRVCSIKNYSPEHKHRAIPHKILTKEEWHMRFWCCMSARGTPFHARENNSSVRHRTISASAKILQECI